MFPIEPTVPQISADEAKQILDSKEKVLLLDVRTTGEYEQRRIKESVNLPLDQVESEIQHTAPDKSVKIIVYCLSGSRSVFAVDFMREMGYENVFNMTNGLLAWLAKGYEIEK